MKKFFITLVIAAVSVVNMNAMSVSRSSREARFLTDKMAWELGLNNAQIEDIYEINFDYFRALESVYDNNLYAYEIRNEEISYVLSPAQWRRYMDIEYFHNPVCVQNSGWVFSIYAHYDRGYFYFDAPVGFRVYNGAHAHNKNHYYAHVNIHLHSAKPVPSPHHYVYKSGRKNNPGHVGKAPHNNAPKNLGNPQPNRGQNNIGKAQPKNEPKNNAQAKPQNRNNNNKNIAMNNGNSGNNKAPGRNREQMNKGSMNNNRGQAQARPQGGNNNSSHNAAGARRR